MATPEDTMREDLSAAMDTVEPDYEEAQAETLLPVDESVEPDVDVAKEPQEDTPKVTAEPEKEDSEPPVTENEEPTGKTDEDVGRESKEPDPAPPAEVAPPSSWTPAAREKWKDVPQDIQQEIAKREGEITKAFEATSGTRKTAERLQQVVTPYQAMMAAEGVTDPFQAINEMFKTTAALSMGSKEQKASRVADLIKHYGVDIASLDNILAGEPQADPELNRMEELLDQRLAPVNELIGTLNQRATSTQNERVSNSNNDVATFSQSAEFIEDVRFDMANIIDAATAGQREMSLQQAYDVACQMNPAVKTVLDARAETERVTNSQALMDRKREASSSIRGAPGGAGGGVSASEIDLRDQLEKAWDGAQEG